MSGQALISFTMAGAATGFLLGLSATRGRRVQKAPWWAHAGLIGALVLVWAGALLSVTP